MKDFKIKERYGLDDLTALVKRLRDPETGCPWDREQTHASIRQNFLEETYEAVDAIDRSDPDALREELGDVLLQVALHTEMEREAGRFDMDDVATDICGKLVLRHPHVFGDVNAKDSSAVLSNWESIKRTEKHQKTGADAVNDVPHALPALMRSQKVQKRAGYVGFDYPNVDYAMEDLACELDELERALRGDGDVAEELGDLIFAAVNVARFRKLDAELCLTKACDKFAGRFKLAESFAAEQHIDMKSASLDELNRLWDRAKEEEKHKT